MKLNFGIRKRILFYMVFYEGKMNRNGNNVIVIGVIN